ncbi:hypothetical protein X546_16455 [Brevibacillus borstelensis cifa_chp40]|nr:hypothetical protein X546_16455 [Brevibacillus borstelensis cifa_chp40]
MLFSYKQHPSRKSCLHKGFRLVLFFLKSLFTAAKLVALHYLPRLLPCSPYFYFEKNGIAR